MIARIPAHFLEVRYCGERYPGNAIGLADGANCQHFCYELLRHFGFAIGNLRSSELWADTQYTEKVEELRELDLLLFGPAEDPYGAHVGLYVGNDSVLHLSLRVGRPVIWPLAKFAELPEYAVRIGVKRPMIRAD